jgi:hypothetical protein
MHVHVLFMHPYLLTEEEQMKMLALLNHGVGQASTWSSYVLSWHLC